MRLPRRDDVVQDETRPSRSQARSAPRLGRHLRAAEAHRADQRAAAHPAGLRGPRRQSAETRSRRRDVRCARSRDRRRREGFRTRGGEESRQAPQEAGEEVVDALGHRGRVVREELRVLAGEEASRRDDPRQVPRRGRDLRVRRVWRDGEDPGVGFRERGARLRQTRQDPRVDGAHRTLRRHHRDQEESLRFCRGRRDEKEEDAADGVCGRRGLDGRGHRAGVGREGHARRAQGSRLGGHPQGRSVCRGEPREESLAEAVDGVREERDAVADRGVSRQRSAAQGVRAPARRRRRRGHRSRLREA
mmetsp:Transcript_17427/g.70030  ORF Transcript_17427/g.70030 Transcript_17427/m.70030 type:complete len:304 (+) Transcript_17427:592-1503(+)